MRAPHGHAPFDDTALAPLWSRRAALALGLYGLAAGFASPGAAETAATSESDALIERLKGLRVGEMRKLEPNAAATPLPDIPFKRGDGSEAQLSDWRGKALLVNFWATWCAPCVTELPSIDRLATRVAEEGLGDRVAVLAISLDRGGPEKPQALFDRIGVTALDLLQDPTMNTARTLKLKGMPTTLLIDAQGRELARLLGDAEWDSAEAMAIMTALAESTNA